MRFKFFSHIIAAALLLAAWSGAASAQVVPASGKVSLKQADGKQVPVQGALVEIYRTDIAGKYQTKTDKNGRYIYAGIPFGGTYTIIVSAPGARPAFLSGLRLSQQGENDFVLEPGDGSRLTLEQVRAAGAATPRGAGAPSAEERKAREEYEKQRAAYEAAKAKAEADVSKLNEILKSGNAASDAKKYDEAISFYDQGIQAAPDEAVFYINKSVALRNRGVNKYNEAGKAKDAVGRGAAKADFKAAVEAADKAITLQRAAASQNAAASKGNAQAQSGGAQNNAELSYLQARAENYRIALQTSTPGVAEGAATAIQEYINVEPDAAKKAKAQVSLADALFQSNQVDQAIATYRQILSTNPNNIDAMYGLAVALAADPSGAKVAEARDAFRQFVAKAPDTDQRKQEAATIVASLDDMLKNANKPATTPSTGTSRRRKN